VGPFAAAAPVTPLAVASPADEDEITPEPRPRRDADSRLTNSTPAGLAAALRNRAERDGLRIGVTSCRPRGDWYPGEVSIQCATRTTEQLADWARATVAPDVMAGVHFLVEGVGGDQRHCPPDRIFGTLEDYLAEGLRLSGHRGGYTTIPDATRTDDWAHWADTVAPELAAALETTARGFRGSDNTAEDVLAAVTALLTPAAATEMAGGPRASWHMRPLS